MPRRMALSSSSSTRSIGILARNNVRRLVNSGLAAKAAMKSSVTCFKAAGSSLPRACKKPVKPLVEPRPRMDAGSVVTETESALLSAMACISRRSCAESFSRKSQSTRRTMYVAVLGRMSLACVSKPVITRMLCTLSRFSVMSLRTFSVS